MSDKSVWESGNLPNALAAVMQSNYLERTFLDLMEKLADHSWTVSATDILRTLEYRGHTIERVRQHWVEPKIPGSWLGFSGPPRGLDANKCRVQARVKIDGHYHYAADIIEAKRLIDDDIELREMAPSLAPLVEALKEMPCTCGEYGSIDDKEYLSRALDILKVARAIPSA